MQLMKHKVSHAALMSLWGLGSCGLFACQTAAYDEPVAEQVPGIPQLTQAIVFTGNCTFSGTQMTVNVNPSDEVVIAQDIYANLTINNTPCGNANATNVKTITVSEPNSTGPEAVVVSFMNGFFALGTTPGTGIYANFGVDPNDKLLIMYPNQNNNITYGAGGINVNGDTTKDVYFTQMPSLFVATMGSGNDSFSGAGDSVTGGPFPKSISIYGGDGNDVLRGGNGNDLLYGLGGDDNLSAEPNAISADTFDGGNGNDTLTYAARTNGVVLSPNTTNGSGETGEGDTIVDTIEIMYGGNGNDTLQSSSNANNFRYLYGGPGNDIFMQQNAAAVDSHDVVSGGAGNDTVDYTVRTINVAVSLDGNPNDGSPSEADNIGIDVENIRTGAGNDTLVGDANNNIFFAGAGNNNISGGAGDDTFQQGSDPNIGNDTMSGGAGTDTVDYGSRTQAITAVMDGTTLSGDLTNSEGDKIGADIENLNSGSGADTITGNPNNNYIQTQGGNDSITSLAGDDICDGGAGTDAIDCGLGNDLAIDGETDSPSCEAQIP